MRTESQKLGLVHDGVRTGDLICILYGCSVPVVLRKYAKTDEQLESERAEDELMHKQKKEEAVLKIQEFWRKKRPKIGKRKSIWRRYWHYSRLIVPAAFVIFITLEHLSLITLCISITLILVFPELLLGKIWSRLVREYRIRLPLMPKKTGGQANRNYYKLIGPCYVHGMMNGEAIMYQNDNQVRPEIFELR